MSMNRLNDLSPRNEVNSNRPVPITSTKYRLPVVRRREHLVTEHQTRVETRAANLLHTPRVMRRVVFEERERVRVGLVEGQPRMVPDDPARRQRQQSVHARVLDEGCSGTVVLLGRDEAHDDRVVSGRNRQIRLRQILREGEQVGRLEIS